MLIHYLQHFFTFIHFEFSRKILNYESKPKSLHQDNKLKCTCIETVEVHLSLLQKQIFTILIIYLESVFKIFYAFT